MGLSMEEEQNLSDNEGDLSKEQWQQRLAGLESTNARLVEQVARQEERIARLQEERIEGRGVEDFYALLQHTPVPVCVFRGPEHVYDMANEYYHKMVNHREVLGKTLREAWPEAEGQGFYELFDTIYSSGEPYHIHKSLAKIDWKGTGELEDTWFHLVYQPFRNQQGEIVGIFHIALDITDQVRMQQQVEDRNARIEQLNQELQAQYDELGRYTRLVRSILDNSTSAIFVKDLEGRYLLTNQYASSFTGLSPAEVIGKTDEAFYPPEMIQAWYDSEQEVIRTGQTLEREETVPIGDDTHITFFSIKFPVYDDAGNVSGLGAICTDITERLRNEEERMLLREQIIESQNAAIRELSTPLMPLADGILAMPLIGSIDSNRALQIMENLLEGVSHHQANIAIVDITGVQVVDTQVANTLLRAAQAVNLLGAQVVLTGISPVMAQTLVHLGSDLSNIVTRSTLQSGIAWAIEKLARNEGRTIFSHGKESEHRHRTGHTNGEKTMSLL